MHNSAERFRAQSKELVKLANQLREHNQKEEAFQNMTLACLMQVCTTMNEVGIANVMAIEMLERRLFKDGQ